MGASDALIDLFLQPGEYFVGDAGFRVRTLLGSCVSVTLWHAERRIGAMSHFLLPRRGATRPGPPDARYGEEALALMVEELAAMGIAAASCQAKIFGGGDMFPQHARRQAPKVGRHNGEAARGLLQAHGIPVVSESLFGVGHRQIAFSIGSGDVWVRQMDGPAHPGRPGQAGPRRP
jgi:chemotaxis protein CheD